MASDLGQPGPNLGLEARIPAVWRVIVFFTAAGRDLVLQALGTIRFRFLLKKSKTKFHACVSLKGTKAFR
jgi:hypothetical protein